MLSALIRFIGLDTPAPPPRPPSARQVAPAPRPPVAPAPKAAVAPAAKTRDERRRRNDELTASALALGRADADRRFVNAVRRIVRDRDPAALPRATPAELAVARNTIGDDVYEYLRACHAAGVRLRGIGEDMYRHPPSLGAYRRYLTERAATDAEGWDRGHVAIIQARKDAEGNGREGPADLQIPGPIQNAIAKNLADRLARLSKRQGQGSGQASQGSATPGAVVPPPVPKTTDDDEPEPDAPAGPKR